jgi:hypothetical protein
MRNTFKSTFWLLILAATFSSCEKKDVAQDVNTLGIGSYVTLVSNGNLNVDATNLASKVSITVKEYGSKQDKIIMYVTLGNTSLDRSTWRPAVRRSPRPWAAPRLPETSSRFTTSASRRTAGSSTWSTRSRISQDFPPTTWR